MPPALDWSIPDSVANNSSSKSAGSCLASSGAAALAVLVPFLRSPRPRFHGLTFWPAGTTAVEAFLQFGALLLVPAFALGVAVIRSKARSDEALFWSGVFPAVGMGPRAVAVNPVTNLVYVANYYGGSGNDLVLVWASRLLKRSRPSSSLVAILPFLR